MTQNTDFLLLCSCLRPMFKGVSVTIKFDSHQYQCTFFFPPPVEPVVYNVAALYLLNGLSPQEAENMSFPFTEYVGVALWEKE